MTPAYRKAFIVALGISVFAGAPARGSEDEMDLATLTAALKSQLSSIASMEVKYRIVNQNPRGETEISEIEWAEQGDCRFLATTYAPEMKRGPYSESFDGSKGYVYRWHPTGERAGSLLIIPSASGGLWEADPPFFIGRRAMRDGPNLPELMESPRAQLVGRETLEGRACWKVFVTDIDQPGGPYQVSAWLDAAHDYLPAKMDIRHAENDLREYPGEPNRKKTATIWGVHEFMRVTDQAAENERWFPKSVTLELRRSKAAFTVNSVLINGAIPLERFRPEPPDGTNVQDRTGPAEPRFYILGGNPASDLLVQRAARDAINELRGRETQAGGPTASTNGIDARPRRPAWAAYGLFGLSLLLLGVAVCFWFRVARS